MHDHTAIIALSHLRWDFVFQRPQHLLSRLAKSHPVYFIEEPVESRRATPDWEFSEPHPNVIVCRPHTPSTARGFSDEQFPYLKPMIAQLLEQRGLRDFILWFYTPMALPATEDLKPRLIV